MLKHKKAAMNGPVLESKFNEDVIAKQQKEEILAEFNAKRAAAKEARAKKKEAKAFTGNNFPDIFAGNLETIDMDDLL